MQERQSRRGKDGRREEIKAARRKGMKERRREINEAGRGTNKAEGGQNEDVIGGMVGSQQKG